MVFNNFFSFPVTHIARIGGLLVFNVAALCLCVLLEILVVFVGSFWSAG